MTNDQVIHLASDLFKSQMQHRSTYVDRADVLHERATISRHAEVSIALAQVFAEEVNAALPPCASGGDTPITPFSASEEAAKRP